MRRGKYEGLAARLAGSDSRTVTMMFDELDSLVGGLPQSAKVHRAWWANEHAGRHVQAHAWLGAGFRVDDVELGSKVVFTRSRQVRSEVAGHKRPAGEGR